MFLKKVATFLTLALAIGCQGLGPKEDTTALLASVESPLNSVLYVGTPEQSIESSVLVEFGYGSGSGFVIETGLNPEGDRRYYRIITAAHVLKEEYSLGYGSKPVVTFTIGKKKKFYPTKILKRDENLDLALLEFWTYELAPFCKIFKIAQNDDYLKYFTEVQLVSYPYGTGPIVTRGFISGVDVLAFDRQNYVANAQSAPGSSGGGIMATESYEIVGMLSAVLNAIGANQFLSWCSLVVPASNIREFLDTPETPAGYPQITPGLDRGKTEKPIIIFYPTNLKNE